MTRRAASRPASHGPIEIAGASANNLKDLNVRIPRAAVTMIVGPSGSGKSSLLVDTLATEANGRMKRFLGLSQDHLETGDVQAFLGALPACIHFAQGGFRASQRTTVATCSGLLSAVRRLFLKHSVPWADSVGEPVPPPSASSYDAWLETHYEGRLTVWAVPLRNVASNGAAVVERLKGLGFETAVLRSETDPAAVWERGRAVDLADFKPLSADIRHVLEIEIGQRKLPEQQGLRGLLGQAFEAADHGSVIVELHDAGPEFADLGGPRGTLLDSDLHRVHPGETMVFAPPSEPLLSFNMPGSERSGACRECQGTGEALVVVEEALITRPERSLHDGALSLWTEKNYKYVNIQHETIQGLQGLDGFDPEAPWCRLPAAARRLILDGSHGTKVEDRDLRTGRPLGASRPFEGFIPAVLSRVAKGSVTAARLANLVRRGPCPACGGTRWSPQARALRLGGLGLADVLGADFIELARLTKPPGQLASSAPPEAAAQVALLLHMATSFIQVGLGHLSGDRGMLTVSEGEARRVRLASLLQARGQGLGLLLDEPARALHEADIVPLVESLRRLAQRHTVILNDHRFSLGRAADLVLVLGPGAGEEGGHLVRSGPPAETLKMDGDAHIQRSPLPTADHHPSLEIRGGTLHTLRQVDVRIPLGRLVAVTGVSGSGKSTFVRGLLVPALHAELGDRVDLDDFAVRGQGAWGSLSGAERIQDVLALDQRSPEANRRSLVATLLGIADTLRKAFATLPDAHRMGLRATDFGLNAGRGRCPACLGLGENQEPGGWVPCSRCGGLRYGEEVLAVRMAGMNVADVLALPVNKWARAELPVDGDLAGLIGLLTDLDLGYISLGRRVDRLSGGEVQRLRIAHRLWRRTTEGLFVVLDEPSAGLHPRDVERLLRVLNRIVSEGGNSVLLVEHNIDLIRACDWVLDFGPGGGPAGGRLIGSGPPDHIESLHSPTGEALRRSSGGDVTHANGKGKKPAPAEITAGTDVPETDTASAQAARSWLRLLLGHETVLPSSLPEAQEGFQGLAAEVNESFLAQCRPHEIGGLDLELARFFLASRPPASEGSKDLAAIWAETPQARLAIQPLLPELQTWGPRVPASVLREASARLDALGLTATGQSSPSSLRASGPRFQPEALSPETCRRAISDALLLGGGYAELLDEEGCAMGVAASRWLDLQEPVVAPQALSSAALSRLERLGSCPACKGNGCLPGLDLDLVLASREASLDTEALFVPKALAILKGVRRGAMIPFFRRMAEEGLWDLGKSFRRLTPWEKDVLLHGYWHRPGPGSFLKEKKSDPQEVGSWLRWDGLVRNVLEQLDRSRDQAWGAAVRDSVQAQECTVCRGSGLARHSRAVRFRGRTVHDWTLHGRIGELWKSLQDSPVRTERDRKTLDRLLHCLGPMAHKSPDLALRDPVGDPALARAVYERVVGSFTSLGVVR